MVVSMTTARVVRRAVRQAVAILQIQVERKLGVAEEGALFLFDFLWLPTCMLTMAST